MGLAVVLALGAAACGLAPNVPNPAHLWTRDWLTGLRPPEGAVSRDAMGNPVLDHPTGPAATGPGAPRP